MKIAEHYARAEEILNEAVKVLNNYHDIRSDAEANARASVLVQMAQVHATLSTIAINE